MKELQRTVFIFSLFVLVVGSLFFASEFLIPLTLAAILSMLFIGFSNWLEKKGIKRGFSAFLSVFILVVFVTVIILLLSWQLSDITLQVEEMKKKLMAVLESVRTWLNQTVGISKQQQQQLMDSQSKAGGDNAGKMALAFASGLMGVMVNTLLVLVYMYLFLYYRSHLKRFLLKIVPNRAEEEADHVVHQCAKVSQNYLSGMATMILCLWIMYSIGFSIAGVENAIFFAVLCGILEIVPFVGNITGTSLTVLAVVAQGGDSKTIIGVVVVYMLVQFIQTYILEPLVVGKQVNINPLFTIMGLVLGELLWGIAGMILAIPLLGILKIIFDHVPHLQPYGFLIGSQESKSENGFLEKLKEWFQKKD
jgi:predicted PurR-regulated permease PerM